MKVLSCIWDTACTHASEHPDIWFQSSSRPGNDHHHVAPASELPLYARPPRKARGLIQCCPIGCRPLAQTCSREAGGWRNRSRASPYSRHLVWRTSVRGWDVCAQSSKGNQELTGGLWKKQNRACNLNGRAGSRVCVSLSSQRMPTR